MSTKVHTPPSEIVAALETVQTEMAMIRAELAAIRELLQKKPDVTPSPEHNLDQFFGMWSDFTPEEEAIFKQIADERSQYFSADPPDLIN